LRCHGKVQEKLQKQKKERTGKMMKFLTMRNYLTKTNLEKAFFIKKQIGKYFFGKKLLEIFFPCFDEGGGNYQAILGIL
jgi:hypothetical protein